MKFRQIVFLLVFVIFRQLSYSQSTATKIASIGDRTTYGSKIKKQQESSAMELFKRDFSQVIRTLDGRLIERYTYGPRDSWGYPADDSSLWTYWDGWNGKSPIDSVIWKRRGPVNLKEDKQNLNSFYLVPPKQQRSGAPLYVVLHSANWTAFQYMARQHLIEGWETIATRVPEDFYALYLNSTNKEWWGWGDRQKGLPAPAEKRAFDIIEWIVKKYDIDQNRIYLSGISMGGCGTLALGMPHGDTFAAIRATVPAGTEYVAARMGGFPPEPPREASQESHDTWTKLISGFGLPDPPVIVDFSAQNDNWSKTQPALLYAAQAGRLPLVLSWGPFGHTSIDLPISRFPQCSIALAYPWLEIRKNEAYPVFTHASCNQQSPWLGDTINFDESGQINAYFRWKSQIDTPTKFVIQLWLAHPEMDNPPPTMPEVATTNITFRRLQHFKFGNGINYTWKLKRNGKVVGSGKITPDAANLLTICKLTLTTIPAEIVVVPVKRSHP